MQIVKAYHVECGKKTFLLQKGMVSAFQKTGRFVVFLLRFRLN